MIYRVSAVTMILVVTRKKDKNCQFEVNIPTAISDLNGNAKFNRSDKKKGKSFALTHQILCASVKVTAKA